MNHFDSISQFNQAIGIKAPAHPLFSISYGTKEECGGDDIEFSAIFFIISFQQLASGNILYGKTKYDHDRGKLSFIKPRQIVTFKNIRLREDCFLILVHEDFMSGTALYLRKVSRVGDFGVWMKLFIINSSIIFFYSHRGTGTDSTLAGTFFHSV